MKASKVEASHAETVVTQGFRGDDMNGISPYVYVAFYTEGGATGTWVELTPENAHILSEEIRKQAEYASAEEEK